MRATIFLRVLRSFPGTGLFGESFGATEPNVLALHGWRRDHNDFQAVLTQPEPLASIALDLPGHGATPAPPQAWGSAEYANALVPVIESMATPIVLLGHSFGGRVAVTLAASRPDLVAGLVLTGVPLFRPGTGQVKIPFQFRVARRLNRAGLLREEQMEAFRQRYGSADYKAASGVMREVLVKLLAEQYEDALGRIDCGVELVWGDDDAEAPLAVAERARDLLGPRANLSVCPGAGHFTPFTVPGELRAAVQRAAGAGDE